MKYNYKCVVAKNGKRYYKNVKGKWKRITNKVGEKAEKGKRKYRVENPTGQEQVPSTSTGYNPNAPGDSSPDSPLRTTSTDAPENKCNKKHMSRLTHGCQGIKCGNMYGDQSSNC